MSTDVTCQLKFQLLFAYGEVQNQLDPSEQDPAWREVQENGELAKAVDAAFASARSPEELTLAQSLRETLEAAGLGR